MRVDFETDVGAVRSSNQDSCDCGLFSPNSAWVIVCDGMGGANGGNVASAIAVETIREQLLSGYDENLSKPNLKNLMINAINRANEEVHRVSLERPELHGMGTTVVCGVCRGGMLQYAHVGDSRIYLFHGHSICQLTKDHSIVQELVEKGSITAEEAAFHPRKNLITRALGVGPQVEIDFGEIVLSPGDILVLCTDGLSNYVTVDEMEEIIQNTAFYEMADALVDRALKAGGLDNVTVLLAKCDATEENNG